CGKGVDKRKKDGEPDHPCNHVLLAVPDQHEEKSRKTKEDCNKDERIGEGLGVLERGKAGGLDREREGERTQFHDDKDRGHHKERDVFLYVAGIHDGVSGGIVSLMMCALII